MRYGACELRRSVVTELEQPLSEIVVRGTPRGVVVVAEMVDGEVALRIVGVAAA